MQPDTARHLPRRTSAIDLILDTFPYTGGTTTCESLWMGVPILTLAGNSMHSRQGASLLSAAGLQNWITCNEEYYANKALSLSGRLDDLAALRSHLRRLIKESPLFDAKRFTGQMEDALWAMWRKCSYNPGSQWT